MTRARLEAITADLSARDVIGLLDLEPHPEGGHFRETFRDGAGNDGRAHSSAIYFLLAEGESSRWHRIDANEVWHWYGGGVLVLEIAHEGEPGSTIHLGPGLDSGERPQAVVPASAWQRAASLGPWSLLGCTVAPGFEFAAFELAPDDWTPGQAG